MPSQLPKFTFRVEAEVLEKLRFIADSNFRTVNKELEMLVKQYIAKYEKENGAIPLSEGED
nr:MAG TPA: Arc-like DNA binding domain protein [Bacteriophage sp.]